MIKHVFLICVCLGAPNLGSAQAPQGKKILKAFPVKNFKTININIDGGSIHISKNPATAFTQVQCIKKNFNDNNCNLTVENQGGQTLFIEVKKKSSFMNTNTCEVDFDITVPKSPAVIIKGGNVALDTKDVNSFIQLDVGQGTITTKSPKKLYIKGGNISIEATDIAGDTTIEAGDATLDFTYTSLTSAPRLIQLSGGALKGTLTVPLAAKIDNKIESALHVMWESDPAPHFILTGHGGTVDLAIKKVGETPSPKKVEEDFQMTVLPPIVPTERAALEEEALDGPVEPTPVLQDDLTENPLESPPLQKIDAEIMDEESFTAPPAAQTPLPSTPAPAPEPISPLEDAPKPSTARSVLEILQPVLSTHP